MKSSPATIWEDDDYVYVPEELFKHLPPEYREAAEKRKEQGINVMRVADADIQNLIRLANALLTTASLGYIYHRLRAAKFDVTTEAYLEQEMLTTAFVVTYARLFVSGNGGGGVSRSQIPAHLRSIHDDLMEARHKRYAHNGGHETIGSGVEIEFDDTGFRIGLQFSSGFYVGGRNEWKELVTFLDAHMHERLHKILARLKAKTGYEWKVPVGPAPDWVENNSEGD
ncbi:hypothetical protein WL21_11715 [Burkholderia ubonensis]|nr:hypothetical protein WJ81_25830 [Burkholderia ubonensis]KVZ69483.1 hypothetical protein WL21_11715 [Burkholderia ubonensis]KVZ71316.1 hypothetical protein WL20_29515 [Burkholderia ubonensis]